MSWVIEKVTPIEDGDVRLDIRVRPWWGWVYRWVFKKDLSYIRSFYGSCTVWYDLDSGWRCWTPTEGVLASLYRGYKIEQKLERAKLRDKK